MQLRANRADVRRHRARVDALIVLPDGPSEIYAGNRRAQVPEQDQRQLIFLVRQPNPLVADLVTLGPFVSFHSNTRAR